MHYYLLSFQKLSTSKKLKENEYEDVYMDEDNTFSDMTMFK
jgi:hypothetical protein